jgi:hypothetical protein
MQVSDSIDDLLEEWEYIKRKRLPYASGIEDLSDYIRSKTEIEGYAHSIRNSRLTNDQQTEQTSIELFTTAYLQFRQDFVFKVLKNDNQTQS